MNTIFYRIKFCISNTFFNNDISSNFIINFKKQRDHEERVLAEKAAKEKLEKEKPQVRLPQVLMTEPARKLLEDLIRGFADYRVSGCALSIYIYVLDCEIELICGCMCACFKHTKSARAHTQASLWPHSWFCLNCLFAHSRRLK